MNNLWAGDDEQDVQQQHEQVDVVALMPPLRGASWPAPPPAASLPLSTLQLFRGRVHVHLDLVRRAQGTHEMVPDCPGRCHARVLRPFHRGSRAWRLEEPVMSREESEEERRIHGTHTIGEANLWSKNRLLGLGETCSCPIAILISTRARPISIRAS
jgi:hypothetical protein